VSLLSENKLKLSPILVLSRKRRNIANWAISELTILLVDEPGVRTNQIGRILSLEGKCSDEGGKSDKAFIVFGESDIRFKRLIRGRPEAAWQTGGSVADRRQRGRPEAAWLYKHV